MNLDNLYTALLSAGFKNWVDRLRHDSKTWLLNHGDYARWSNALASLPVLQGIETRLDDNVVTVEGRCDRHDELLNALKALSPWRKGPFQIAGVFIDTEWRSDFKWTRVQPHIQPLQGKRILDIGCGNGYHCWRMLAENPQLVVGIEPSVLFNLQFQALQNYIKRPEIHLLPLTIEDLPDDMNWFDTVFSMGVLYHRKSPIEHIYKLKSLLRTGGELCLETLVVDGEAGQVLVPEERYARMRNVWFIPSAVELKRWLERCGFCHVRIVDVSVTKPEEQRSTEWMQFESLLGCLQADNHKLTVEGHPAPKRAVLIAEKSRL
ncbi:MAG: tRNA 5-methoxyuridine(34)/uridine 5-oxyacetic acid(34) synthase CmoB [Aestuariibacter sp.]|nr:tRNA 5-methoxyuridine(34)/uridine 5-oxyacetic acid(34) synthase CmoB [Aestuariibacter sp.]